MSWTQAVYSSVAQEVGFDDETGELIVTWRNGKKSAYEGVPETLAQQLVNAGSVGTMLNMEIKPYYKHRYV